MGALVGIALIWFVIEMLLWYLVAQFISGWYVFFGSSSQRSLEL
ncbi:hypothetical protein AO371_1571 [Moraxella catarrhalis]|nr:hypothetical protein AO371_1571 [Moraxella catarrhalis]